VLLVLLVLLLLLMLGRVLVSLSQAPAAPSGAQWRPQATEHIKDVFDSQCCQRIWGTGLQDPAKRPPGALQKAEGGLGGYPAVLRV